MTKSEERKARVEAHNKAYTKGVFNQPKKYDFNADSEMLIVNATDYAFYKVVAAQGITMVMKMFYKDRPLTKAEEADFAKHEIECKKFSLKPSKDRFLIPSQALGSDEKPEQIISYLVKDRNDAVEFIYQQNEFDDKLYKAGASKKECFEKSVELLKERGKDTRENTAISVTDDDGVSMVILTRSFEAKFLHKTGRATMIGETW